MKKQIITTITALIFLFAIAFAAASIDVTYNVYQGTLNNSVLTASTTPVANFNFVAYACADVACTTNAGQFVAPTSVTGNSIVVTFPTTFQAPGNGYNLYFYQDDWIAWEQTSVLIAGTANPVTAPPVYLSKAVKGNATINSVTLNNTNPNVGEAIQITTNIQSALEDISTSTIPPEFAADEDVNTTVTLDVLDSTSTVIYTETRYVQIMYSTNQNTVFTYVPTVADNLTLRITTNVVSEPKILSSITQTDSTNIIQVNNVTFPAPMITIVNPINGNTYNTAVLPLDVTANQTINTWIYNLNGVGNVTFTPNTTIVAVNGSNTITVWGSNANGIGSDTNIFNVNLGGNASNGTVPVINIVNPITSTTYNTLLLPLDVTANQPIVTWIYNLNGGVNQSFTPNTTITGVNGTNTLYVYGTNVNGTGVDSVIFTINVNGSGNGTAPTVNIVNPVQGNTYNSTTVALDVTANQPITTWQYRLNGGTLTTFTPNTTIVAAEGFNTLTVTGTNANGSDSDTVTFNVNLGSNSTAPNINLISPVQGNTYTSTTINLRVTTDQNNVSWSYILNGGTLTTFTPNTTFVAIEGVNTLLVYASNVNGTRGVMVTFTVDTGDDDDDDDDDDDGNGDIIVLKTKGKTSSSTTSGSDADVIGLNKKPSKTLLAQYWWLFLLILLAILAIAIIFNVLFPTAWLWIWIAAIVALMILFLFTWPSAWLWWIVLTILGILALVIGNILS